MGVSLNIGEQIGTVQNREQNQKMFAKYQQKDYNKTYL